MCATANDGAPAAAPVCTTATQHTLTYHEIQAISYAFVECNKEITNVFIVRLTKIESTT